MLRFLTAFAVALAGVTLAWAQSSNTNTGSNTGSSTSTQGLADRTPGENVRGGHVRERAPSAWISVARARHSALQKERVGAARTGQQGNSNTNNNTGGNSTTGSNSTTTGGFDLTDLLGLANLGGLGDLGSLAGLLGDSTGSTGTSGLADNVGTSGGNGLSGINPADFTTIEDLMRLYEMLQGSGGGSTAKTRVAGGAVSRLPDPDLTDRAQQQTEDRSFRARWVDAMLKTFFTAITLAFQSSDFIDALAGGLQGLLPVPDAAADSSSGDGTGNGVEDVAPGDTSGGDDGSIVRHFSPPLFEALGFARLT